MKSDVPFHDFGDETMPVQALVPTSVQRRDLSNFFGEIKKIG